MFVAPKNFKRGRLIANKYTIKDLLIVSIGISVSLIAEIIFLTTMISGNLVFNIGAAIIFFLPAATTLLLIVPNGIYHNIMTFIQLFIIEIFSPKKYIWKGIDTNVPQRQ